MKIYVLDTNVLIHDPECVFKFEENLIVVPMTVVEELDSLKGRKSNICAEARKASANIKLALQDPDTNIEVVSTEPEKDDFLDLRVPDNQILWETYNLHHEVEPEVVLITKDTNMWIKGKALGLNVEDYRNDSVNLESLTTCISLPGSALLGAEQKEGEDSFTIPKTELIGHYEGDIETVRYVCLGGRDVYPFEGYKSSDECTIHSERFPYPSFFGIKPKNVEQRLAMTALADDTDFVCLEGPAGSGKTLLALAYALEYTIERKKFKSVIVLRSGDPDAIGFLPGTEEEKVKPWLQGFIDNLEVLVGDEEKPDETIRHTIELANLKFRALELVRGRSYQDTLIIVDEAQNNTRHQLKAILTRIGEGSKVIVLGNLAQIDTPYLNERTSGLAHVCNVMSYYKHGAVCLFRDIQRSRLTKFAEENL